MTETTGRHVTVMSLSLWQPWADLISMGLKTIETRTWSTTYRGPLLICAAKTNNQEVKEAISLYQSEGSDLPWETPPLGPDYTPRRGVAVALVDLVDCRRMVYEDRRQAVFAGDPTGRWGWVLDNVRPLDPFPIKGQRGLFHAKVYEVFQPELFRIVSREEIEESLPPMGRRERQPLRKGRRLPHMRYRKSLVEGYEHLDRRGGTDG